MLLTQDSLSAHFWQEVIEAEGFHQHLIKKKLESALQLTIASLYYKVLTTQNVN